MLFTEGLIKKLFLLFSTDNGILKNTKTENIWLESGETFHVMRDHPDHNAPMPQEWTKLIKAMSSGKYLTICHLSRGYVAISHLHIAQYAINYF